MSMRDGEDVKVETKIEMEMVIEKDMLPELGMPRLGLLSK